MEAYKSSCKACRRSYYWTGYKTGLGKTPEQLAQMRRDETVCRYCGKEGLKTGLDTESPAGRAFDESANMLAQALFGPTGNSAERSGSGLADDEIDPRYPTGHPPGRKLRYLVTEAELVTPAPGASGTRITVDGEKGPFAFDPEAARLLGIRHVDSGFSSPAWRRARGPVSGYRYTTTVEFIRTGSYITRYAQIRDLVVGRGYGFATPEETIMACLADPRLLDTEAADAPIHIEIACFGDEWIDPNGTQHAMTLSDIAGERFAQLQSMKLDLWFGELLIPVVRE